MPSRQSLLVAAATVGATAAEEPGQDADVLQADRQDGRDVGLVAVQHVHAATEHVDVVQRGDVERRDRGRDRGQDAAEQATATAAGTSESRRSDERGESDGDEILLHDFLRCYLTKPTAWMAATIHIP